MNYHFAEIRAIELNLAHVSNKHKLVFTFFNKTFISRTYNLVIQFNDCRKIEKIVLSTHGLQTYEYYMNKNCVSNKKSVLKLFSELISTIDDTDRSNIFSINKLVYFLKQKTISLNQDEIFETSLPYNWLFKWENDEVIDVIIGEYIFALKNILDLKNQIIIKEIANISILKQDKIAAIEWDFTKVKLESPFLETSNFIIKQKANKKNNGWILYGNIYTERNSITDGIYLSNLTSNQGLLIPFYNQISPLVFQFTFKANFLYTLNYSFSLSLKKQKQLMANDCSNNVLFCLKIDRWNSISDNRFITSYSIAFNEKDIRSFLYNGMKYSWFEKWSQPLLKVEN